MEIFKREKFRRGQSLQPVNTVFLFNPACGIERIAMDTPIYLLIKGCPKGDWVKLGECLSCQHNRGVEGEWPEVKVKCELRPDKKLDVEKIVYCPFRGRSVSFKKCLRCPLNNGFYGFHNNSPVVHCGLYSAEKASPLKLSLLI